MKLTRQQEPSLHEKIHRLKALVDSFAAVNASLELKTVLTRTLKTATRLMDAEIASIALINTATEQLEFVESTDPQFEKLRQLSVPLGKGIAGSVAQTGKSICLKDIHKDPRFYKKIDQEIGRSTSSYICTPLVADNKIIGTAQIMNCKNNKAFTQNDVQLMEGFASQAALAIRNARAHELELKQQSIEHEMQLCAEIQKNMFPKTVPDIPAFQFYGNAIPAKQVGGDYYNCFQYDDNCVDLLLADISGKGLPAAILLTQLHTCYQLLAQAKKPLGQTAKELNEFLCSTLMAGRFITAFIGRLCAGEEKIDYVLAGHPPPVLIHKDASVQRLVRTGPIFGFDHHASPSVESVPFLPGDMLVVFSDGYSEAQNQKEELFGEERILRVITENMNKPMAEIHKILQNEVDSFRGTELSTDDTSILMLYHSQG